MMSDREHNPEEDLDLLNLTGLEEDDIELGEEDLDAVELPSGPQLDEAPDDAPESGSFEDIEISQDLIVSASAQITGVSERTRKKKAERDMLRDFMLQPQSVLKERADRIKQEADALREVAAQRKRTERAAIRAMEKDREKEAEAEKTLEEVSLEGENENTPAATLDDYIRPTYVPDSSILTDAGKSQINSDFENPLFQPLILEDGSLNTFNNMLSPSNQNRIRRTIKTIAGIAPTYNILEKSDLLMGNRLFDRIGVFIKERNNATHDQDFSLIESYVDNSGIQTLHNVNFENGWSSKADIDEVKVCVTSDKTYIVVKECTFSGDYISNQKVDIALAFEGGYDMLKAAIRSQKPLIRPNDLTSEVDALISYICDGNKKKVMNKALGVRGYKGNQNNDDIENAESQLRGMFYAGNNGRHQEDVPPYLRQIPTLVEPAPEVPEEQRERDTVSHRRIRNISVQPAAQNENENVEMSREGIHYHMEKQINDNDDTPATIDVSLKRDYSSPTRGGNFFLVDSIVYKRGDTTVEFGNDALMNRSSILRDSNYDNEGISSLQRISNNFGLLGNSIDGIMKHLNEPEIIETDDEAFHAVYDKLGLASAQNISDTDWDAIRVNGAPFVDKETLAQLKSRMDEMIAERLLRRHEQPENRPEPGL